MDGSVQTGPGKPRVLVEETRRVLDAQQQLIHQQRSRATSAIRIILTACGLLLTLVSLGLTTDLVNGEPTGFSGAGTHAGGIERTLALVLLATAILLVCRMLCAALVVLEPRTAAHPLAGALTTPVLGASRPPKSIERTPAGIPFGGPPAYRAGLDADAATELSETTDPYPAVLAYNAGCVAGNAAITRHNRWYLARVYRSAIITVVLVTGALVAVLVLYGA